MQNGAVLAPAQGASRAASPWHTILVLAVEATLSVRGFMHAGHARSMVNPDRVTMYQHTIFFQWMVFVLVIVGVRLHGTSLYAVLGERWRNMRQVGVDLGIAFALLMSSIMVPAIFGPHQDGASADKAIQFLLPQRGAEIAWWIVLSLTAGICEETLYRGYLQRQFIAFTKNVPAGIFLSVVLFGAAHGYQGLWKAGLITGGGVILGAAAYWRRSVRPGMIAHTVQDLIGGLMRH
jgi:membrane protease YdiL (CAAX protease family)